MQFSCNIIHFLTAVVLTTLLAACSRDNPNKANTQTAKPPVAVETKVAVLSTLVDGIDVTGTLEPKFFVDIRTQIPGLINQVFVNEWVRVKKGQPLASIDLAETEAQVKRAEAAIASAKANLSQTRVTSSRSERELARILKLKEAGLATQQAVDDARSELEASTARVEAAQAQIRVAEEELRQGLARKAKGLVTAPIEGIVALRDVNVGDLASDAAAGKPIFRIVDNRLLNLTVTLSSADSARVKIGDLLEFNVDSLPGKTFKGRVMFINPELSSADRSLKVIAEVRNIPETLKGGLFAKGRIITGQRPAVLLVPRSAVSALDLAAGKGVIHVIENGIARKRDLSVGTINGDLVEVKSGIKPGEQYVLRGGFNLKEGDRITAVAAR